MFSCRKIQSFHLRGVFAALTLAVFPRWYGAIPLLLIGLAMFAFEFMVMKDSVIPH